MFDAGNKKRKIPKPPFNQDIFYDKRHEEFEVFEETKAYCVGILIK